MSAKVMVARTKDRKAVSPPPRRPGQHLDYPTSTVGTSPGGVQVLADTGLGNDGQAVGQSVLSNVDADLSALSALFGKLALSGVVVVVANIGGNKDGNGGAYHYGCADTTLYVDCDTADPAVTSALVIAEAVECFSALQARGWDCGNTNGEGLSRVLAEDAYPGKLDAYSTAGAWLDGSRPNWIDQQQGSDTDDQSNGCACLFLWWLVSLGYSFAEIVAAAGSTLAQTYESLTGKASAWSDFSAAVEAQWPAGKPSGVKVDNPWPPAEPTPPPPPPPAGDVLTLSSDTGAGSYLLVPVPAQIAGSKLFGALAADLSSFLQALARVLGDLATRG